MFCRDIALADLLALLAHPREDAYRLVADQCLLLCNIALVMARRDATVKQKSPAAKGGAAGLSPATIGRAWVNLAGAAGFEPSTGPRADMVAPAGVEPAISRSCLIRAPLHQLSYGAFGAAPRNRTANPRLGRDKLNLSKAIINTRNDRRAIVAPANNRPVPPVTGRLDLQPCRRYRHQPNIVECGTPAATAARVTDVNRPRGPTTGRARCRKRRPDPSPRLGPNPEMSFSGDYEGVAKAGGT